MTHRCIRSHSLHVLTLGWFALLLCGFCLACIVPRSAFAVPAAPWAQTAVQPDGSTVTYRVYGDEDFSYYATEGGLLLQRDPETKALCFVEGDPESGYVLGASASDAVAATDRYAVVDDLGSDRAKASYSALAGAEYGTGVSKDFTLLSQNASQVATYGLSRSSVGTLPSSIPLLAIVVGFDDQSEKNDDTPYRDDYDWTEALFDDEYSTQKFWSDASNGSFTFMPAAESSSHGTDGNTNVSDAANDGVVHVTIPRAHGNWGGDHVGDEDFIETLSLACDEARSYVDFGAFDKSGNGVIENDELAVTFILAGYEASTGAETEKHVWAHANSGVEISTDPVNINRYIVMGETERMQSSSGTMLEHQGGSGSVTHELGHYIGLPDLYNTTGVEGDWSTFDVHGLSTMGDGSWGTDGDYSEESFVSSHQIPTELDPVCRMLLGFLDPVRVSDEGSFEVDASTNNVYCFAAGSDDIDDGGEQGEFFFVENRQMTGFDKGLYGLYDAAVGESAAEFGGLVVWHWDRGVWNERDISAEDETLFNTVNTPDHRPALMPSYIEVLDGDARRALVGLPFRNAHYLEDVDARASSDQLLVYGGSDDPDKRVGSGWGVLTGDESKETMSFQLVKTDEEVSVGQESASIYFTNDVHGAGLEADSSGFNYASVAALEREGSSVMGSGNVTLLDAGDAVQGNALATLTKGDGVVSAMTATGYDLAIAGNHEFDYGLDQLKTLVSKAKKGGIEYLGVNIDSLPTNDLLFGKGSSIETYLIGGKEVKIGFVGITTPESLTKSRPANFQDENGTTIVGFCQDETGEALYKRVQEQVDKLKAEGVDHVVAIGHLGNVGVTPRWSSEAVIANTTGIDVVIDGHSHESYNRRIANKDGADTLLVQTGSNLAAIGELTLDASGTFTAELIAPEDYTKKDAQVQDKLVSHQSEFEELLNEELGTSEVDMPWESDEGIRLATIGETNLGDLIADAYRVRMGADIGLTNAGGIRGPIDEGTLTYGELLTVQPFNNNICVIEATGQEIIDALEMGAAVYPDSSNKLLQISGLSYAIDPDVKSTVVVDEKGSFVSVDGQRRVCDVKVGGQPIDLGATYTVASHTFLLRDGGDGMSMFVDNDVVVDEGITDIQVLIDYVSQDLDGVIGAGYENAAGAGRITEADASGDGDGGGSGGSDGSGDGQDAYPAPGDQGNGADPSDGESAAGEGNGLPSTGDEGRLPIVFGALAIVAFLAALGAVYARRGR